MEPIVDVTAVGRPFVDALGVRDFSRLQRLFHPTIRFRALVPPGLRTAEDADKAVEHLRQWFGDSDRFDILASSADHVGTRERVSYRIRLRELGVWYTVEQVAFVDVRESRIESIDLLCSGFLRETQEIKVPPA